MKNTLLLGCFILVVLGCQKPITSINSVVTPVIANQIQFNGNGFVNNGLYPKLFTCDSSGFSPGVQWSNAPSTTTNFAITMYTIPGPGDKHVYWVLYNIPITTNDIPNNSKSIGIFGINTVDGKPAYTPPCSQGAGPKIYVLTVYALNAPPTITVPNSQVTMDILLSGMKDKIVDSAVMSVTYTRL